MIHTTAKKYGSGFTLVELLVAIAVFIVVMTISLGSILSIMDASRKAKNLKTMMTNLNFSIDVMAREIKFGKKYYCGIDVTNPHIATQNCSSGGTSITFTTSTGVDTIYTLSSGQIQKSINHGGTYIGVTSPEVTIQDLKFFVLGSTFADTIQPKVLVLIRGYAGSKPTTQSSFVLQTTLSQRELDR